MNMAHLQSQYMYKAAQKSFGQLHSKIGTLGPNQFNLVPLKACTSAYMRETRKVFYMSFFQLLW